MITLTADIASDLALLRQQTTEVRAALAHTHSLGADRSVTVARLRGEGVSYRAIAEAMGATVPAVQGILDRAAVRGTKHTESVKPQPAQGVKP